MFKLLDGNGLKHVWGKVKGLFGTTFVEKDGAVEVATPVNGVLTQNAFDALPDEEKKRGLFIIRDGEEPGSSGSVGLTKSDAVPIGTIISFMGLNAPKDYLICDGSIYKISDYPNLARFFKEQFGSETYFGGSDVMFAMPDMRNLFLRGYHGEADETLSGDVGKKQEGTVHPAFQQGFGSNGNPFASFSALKDGGVSSPRYVDGSSAGNATQWLRSSEFNTSSTTLTYTSRPVNMAVLYCIKAVDSQTVHETFEEYDTTVDDCNWHVRKWANGYVEMFSHVTFYNISLSAWGPLYRSALGGSIRLPIDLVEKYIDNASMDGPSTVAAILIRWLSEDRLKYTNGINIINMNNGVVQSFSCRYMVTGRWK